jgi:hypothetical protein
MKQKNSWHHIHHPTTLKTVLWTPIKTGWDQFQYYCKLFLGLIKHIQIDQLLQRNEQGGIEVVGLSLWI